MGRPRLSPESRSVRVQIRLAPADAGRWTEHARATAPPGEVANISAMIRRAVEADIERRRREGD